MKESLKELGANHSTSNANPFCCLCPPVYAAYTNSPMKRVSSSKWAHVECTQYILETYIDESDSDFPIKGVEDIDPSAYILKCIICEKKSCGVCVNCADQSCSYTFHPQCALRRGLRAEPPHIYCPDHSNAPKQTKPSPLPAHMVKSEKPTKTKTPKTVLLNHRFTSSPSLKHLRRIKSSEDSNQFAIIEDNFKKFPHESLSKSSLPYEKKAISGTSKPPQCLNKCSVLVHGTELDALAQFNLVSRERKKALSDAFIVQPYQGEVSQLKSDMFLKYYKLFNREFGSDLEINGRCLSESECGFDEVSRELLYCLEYLSRKVLPSVNHLKGLLSLLVEKQPVRLDMSKIYEINREAWLVTQWGFIYRCLKDGLSEKDPSDYELRFHCIEECDCSICYHCNEEEAILNPLISCRGCKLLMHRACLGFQTYIDDYYCDLCRERADPRCIICQKKNGPMKKAGPEWFHISCALWDPKRVEFEDTKCLEGLRICGENMVGQCIVCHKSDGLLSQCKDCGQLAHLFCAWKNGMMFETEDYISSGIRKLLIKFVCHSHTPNRNADEQKELRSRPFRYYETPRAKRKRLENFSHLKI
ncbi:JADE2_1 [Blepharisma stoltei]|uniref:PHD-type domain-containing protein n=1 Tax=Blepharisma stoltei TaxID=1481888 RepID=A0AAU9JST2_9CILI|nr:unnamed protein product [Blepharisma stoltei]